MLKQYVEAIESSNIVSRTDIDGIITFVNDEFCKISKYSREELIGRNHNIVRHPDVPAKKFKTLWDTILQKKTYKSTVKNMAKDGSTFYVNTTIVPILDEKGEILEFVAIRYDVTREVELKIHLEEKEKELETLNKTLEERVRVQTEKLFELNRNLEERVRREIEKNKEKQKILLWQSRFASLGQMSANIAHQWRQPLTELQLTMYNMKSAVSRGKGEEEVEKIYQEGKKIIATMSQTLENFMDFFKPNRKMVAFSLSESKKDALALIAKALQKDHIEVEVEGDGNIVVMGIANELTQVLLNILQNARDALLSADVRRRLIRIRFEEDGRDAVIVVSDNAGGIDEDIIDKIFEPYFSTKHSSQGTGLGLFMSRLIIQKSFGGSISVKNEDEGALFTIRIPKGRREGERRTTAERKRQKV
jgi:PAS domain S-box-containing protein